MGKSTKKIQVIQSDEVIPTDVIAKAVVDISEGIKKLRSGPLNEKALLLLIQHSAPTKGYNGGRYGISEIKDILDGIESLKETYLKTQKK